MFYCLKSLLKLLELRSMLITSDPHYAADFYPLQNCFNESFARATLYLWHDTHEILLFYLWSYFGHWSKPLSHIQHYDHSVLNLEFASSQELSCTAQPFWASHVKSFCFRRQKYGLLAGASLPVQRGISLSTLLAFVVTPFNIFIKTSYACQLKSNHRVSVRNAF